MVTISKNPKDSQWITIPRLTMAHFLDFPGELTSVWSRGENPLVATSSYV